MTATILSSVKRVAQAGAVALAIGAAGFAATPARADSNVGFSLSFNFPNAQVTFSNQGHNQRRFCASAWQVVNAFERHGYWGVRVIRQQGNWIRIEARKGNYEYTYRVNRCTWQVVEVDRERIRPQFPFPHHPGPWNPGPWGGGHGGNWGWGN